MVCVMWYYVKMLQFQLVQILSEAYYSGVYIEQLPTFKVHVFHQKFCWIVAGFIDAKKLLHYAWKVGFTSRHFLNPLKLSKFLMEMLIQLS